MLPDPAGFVRRLAPKIEHNDLGCWLFTGAIDTTGYGRMGRGRRADGVGHVHRMTYELWRGPIPTGLHIDHLCRERRCCNPWHLQAVTQTENNRRAAAHRMGLAIDHPFYTYGVPA